jgi:hypothetical protein
VQITVSPADGLSDVNLPSTGSGVYTLDVTNGTGTFTAKAGSEGAYTVTAQDLSVAQQPKGSATMANLPGPVQAYDVFSGTTNVSSSPGLDVTSSNVNTAIPVFVRAVDAAGNPVVSNGTTYVDLSSSAASGTYAFRQTPDGADLNPAQVDIPAGSTGVEVYYVPTTQGSVTLTAAAATQQTPSIHETSVTATNAAPGKTITVTVQPENGAGQDVEIPSGDTIWVTPMSNADVTSVTRVEASVPSSTTGAYTATFTAGSSAGTAQFMAQLYDGSTLVETFATEPTAQVTELAGVTPSLSVLQTLHGMLLSGYSTSGASSYAIYRSTGTTSVKTSGTPYATTSGTTYDDTNVTPGTVYNYAVVAVDANGAMSSPSNTVSDEYGTGLASSQAALQTSPTTVMVTFQRTSPTKSENLLSGSATANDFAVSAPGAATQVAQSATVSGDTVTLTFGSTLPSNATLTVAAGAVLDSAGVGNAAGQAALQTVSPADSGTVTLKSNSSVTAAPSNITLDVTPVDANGDEINGLSASAFTVTSSDSAASPTVVSATQTAAGDPYVVTVTDENANEASDGTPQAQTLTVNVDGVAQTQTASVTVDPAVSAAQDISATETSTGATVTWTAPATGTAASYNIWQIPYVNGSLDKADAKEIAKGVSASDTSYAVTGLTAGDSYAFNVDAVDAYGNVVFGTPSSVIEYGSTATSVTTAAGSNTGTGTITLTFDKNGIKPDTTAADWTVNVNGSALLSSDYTVAVGSTGTGSDNAITFTLTSGFNKGDAFSIAEGTSNTSTDAAGAPLVIPPSLFSGLTLP